MRALLDTNILTRAVQPSHPMHTDALDALDALRQRGEELCIIPQNLYEFWVVATRPLTMNGHKLNIILLMSFGRSFRLLPAHLKNCFASAFWVISKDSDAKK